MKRGTLPIQTATTLELFGTGRILFLAGSPIRRKATTSCSVCGKLLTFLVTVVGALLTYAQLRQVPLSSIRERCGSVEVSCPVGEPAAVIFQYAALLGLSSLNKKRPKFNCAEGYEWLRAHFRANSFNSDVHVMHTEKFDPAKDKCCQFKEELLNLPCESDAVVRHNLRSFLYFQDQRKKMQSELMPKDLNANCRPSNGSLGDEELRSKANCSRIGIYMPWRRPPNETDVKIESLFSWKSDRPP
uniref:Uncharacterized protein n=1 Tax=Trichuris muris TaxID=70415 RepID=A0A5S6Q7C7_TRIMR